MATSRLETYRAIGELIEGYERDIRSLLSRFDSTTLAVRLLEIEVSPLVGKCPGCGLRFGSKENLADHLLYSRHGRRR